MYFQRGGNGDINIFGNQAERWRRHGHIANHRNLTVHLIEPRQRIAQGAIKGDAALFRHLKPFLRFQYIQGNAGATLHPLIFELELTLDCRLIIARQFDQAKIA